MIAQRELRNQNVAVMAAVAAGETFVVTLRGAPVAELRPLVGRARTFVPKGCWRRSQPRDLERIADQRL